MKPLVSTTQTTTRSYGLQVILFTLCLLSQLNSLIAGNTIPPITDEECTLESTTTCACDPVSDSLALVALYTSTNGNGWNDNTNWLEAGQPIGTWYGIETNAEGCVTCIDLDGYDNCSFSYSGGNNLEGNIPSELGNLSNLTFLSLQENQLSGNIPSELANLNNLTSLYLHENQLSGNIPSELGNLYNLTSLYLHENQLSGNIPSELANLNNLTQLYLYDNQLSGNIPPEIGNLSNLTFLSLHENQLSGNIPSELGNLSNLTYLSLSNNKLSGNIPNVIGNLSNLIYLNLSHNELSGIIPAEIGQLSNLTNLHLGSNFLSGIIPPQLGLLSNLTQLILQYNSLSGSIPLELRNLNNLITLWLDNNYLSGTIPVELGELNKLVRLTLSHNMLEGNIPIELEQLSDLTYLMLGGNQLSGCFPQSLDILCDIQYNFSNNPSLPWGGDFQNFCNGEPQTGASCNDGNPNTNNDIIQDDCSCSGELVTNTCSYQDSLVLVELYNATHENGAWFNEWNLTEPMETWFGVTLDSNRCVICLDLDGIDNCSRSNDNNLGNNLNGNIPIEIVELSNLEGLILSYNSFDTLPPELGYMISLKKLILSYCSLSGSIPAELGNLINLEELYLNNNSITDTLPSELGNLINLTDLGIYNCNSLTGTIPPELENLSNLDFLWLSNNDLNGNIPPGLGNLINLSNLALSSNELTGSIPIELGNLSELRNLYLSNNQFTGNIPSQIGQLTNLVNLNLNSNRLNGNIPSTLEGLMNLKRFLIHENQFTFENILHNLDTLNSLINLNQSDNNDNYDYAFQAPIFVDTLINATEGYSLAIDLLIDEDIDSNIYTWYKDGAYYQTINGENKLIFDELMLSDTGVYNCHITNPLADSISGNYNTDFDTLTLYSRMITIEVNPNCRMNDSLALVALYNATDGPNWDTTWVLSDPIDTWYGVTTNAEGCVTCIDLDGDDNCSLASNGGNKLSGGIPIELRNLSNLQGIYLSNNQLIGYIPSELGNLSNLRYLNLSYNSLFGPIPTELGDLSELKGLNLSYNSLSGPIPTELSDLSELQSLHLGENELSGNIPSELGDLSELQSLHLGENELSGNIPSELGDLSELRSLHLGENELSGNIPSELGSLNYLIFFYLNKNNLSGAIPPELGSLYYLSHLSLSYNSLSGNIPPELGSLINLNSLSLRKNKLSGNIPSELGDLSELQALFLNENELSGNIPTELSNLNNLHLFYIGYNKFTFENVLHNLDILESFIDINGVHFYNNYEYAFQDSIYQNTTFNLTEGEALTIDLLIDDTVSTNVYTWYKDGEYFETIYGENVLVFDEIMLSDTGVYNCHITNPLADGISGSYNPDFDTLTLYSRMITINVAPDCDLVTASIPDTTYIICDSTGLLLPIALSGTAPFELIYSDGSTNDTVNISFQLDTLPLFVQPIMDTTVYSLVSIEDATGCFGALSGTTTVYSKDLPLAPVVYCGDSASGCLNITFDTVANAAYYEIAWTDDGTWTPTDSLGGHSICGLSNADGAFDIMVRAISLDGCVGFTTIINCEYYACELDFQYIEIIESTCYDHSTGEVFLEVNNGTAPYEFILDSTMVQDSLHFINLSSGEHSVQVIDTFGCESNLTFVVPYDTIFLESINTVDASCFGVNDGIASVFPSGGLAPYTYAWSSGETENSIDNLSGDSTYIVSVTDSNDCTETTSLSITQPPEIVLSIDSTNLLCNGDASGSATVFIDSGGVIPFEYEWSSGHTEDQANNLSAGSYTVTVTDSDGCQSSISIAVEEPTALSLLGAAESTSCFGLADGKITPSVVGGTGNYSFEWDTNDQDSILQNVGAGIYTLMVSDGSNCSITESFEVFQPDSISVELQVDSVSCNGETDGVATIENPSGGTAPYSYQWSSSDNTTAIENNLSAGNYTLTIIDDHGCVKEELFDIEQADELAINISTTDLICFDINEGRAAASVTGGIAPYEYTWSTDENTDSISALAASTYSLTITDASDCLAIETFDIISPDELSLALDQEAVDCYDNETGTAMVTTVTGGTPNSDGNYNYLWSTGGTAIEENNLASGTYRVTVIDDNNCQMVDSITVASPDELVISSTDLTHIACHDEANGSINLQIEGGNENYIISWKGETEGSTSIPENDYTISNLASGTYLIEITDTEGCTISEQVELTQPSSALNVALTDDSETLICNATSLGYLSVQTTGGTGSYTYEWGNDQGLNLQGHVFQYTTLQNIPIGNYSVSVTDVNGCETIENFLVEYRESFTVDISGDSIICENTSTTLSVGSGFEQYQWSNSITPLSQEIGHSITIEEADTYQVIVTDESGCTATSTFDLTVSPLPIANAGEDMTLDCANEMITLNTESPLSLDIEYLWETANGSIVTNATTANPSVDQAGTYVLTVDDGLCIASDTMMVNNNQLQAEAQTQQASCNGEEDASISINATGGNSHYEYSLDGESFQSSPVFDSLSAGEYIAMVQTEDCMISLDAITIDETEPIELELGDDVTVNLFDTYTIEIETINAADPVSYEWSPSELLNCADCPSPEVLATRKTTFQLMITDANGCTAIDEITIDFEGIFIPDVFTPNDDGVNDDFDIIGIDHFPENHITIFNRWGEIVFDKEHYEQGPPWDGTYNGKLLPDATYYYILRMDTSEGEVKQGKVAILR